MVLIVHNDGWANLFVGRLRPSFAPGPPPFPDKENIRSDAVEDLRLTDDDGRGPPRPRGRQDTKLYDDILAKRS